MLDFKGHAMYALLMTLLKDVADTKGCVAGNVLTLAAETGIEYSSSRPNVVLAYGIKSLKFEARFMDGSSIRWRIEKSNIGHCRVPEPGVPSSESYFDNYTITGNQRVCYLDFGTQTIQSSFKIVAYSGETCKIKIQVNIMKCNSTTYPPVNATGFKYRDTGYFHCLNEDILVNAGANTLAKNAFTFCNETAKWDQQEFFDCLSKRYVNLSGDGIIQEGIMSVEEGVRYTVTCSASKALSASLVIQGAPYKTVNEINQDHVDFEVFFHRNQSCMTIQCITYTKHTNLRSEIKYEESNITTAGNYSLDVKYGPKDIKDNSCTSGSDTIIKFTFSTTADVLSITLSGLRTFTALNWTNSSGERGRESCRPEYHRYHVYRLLNKTRWNQTVLFANVSYTILSKNKSMEIPINVTINCSPDEATSVLNVATGFSESSTRGNNAENSTVSTTNAIQDHLQALIGGVIGMIILLIFLLIALCRRSRRHNEDTKEDIANPVYDFTQQGNQSGQVTNPVYGLAYDSACEELYSGVNKGKLKTSGAHNRHDGPIDSVDDESSSKGKNNEVYAESAGNECTYAAVNKKARKDTKDKLPNHLATDNGANDPVYAVVNHDNKI